MQAPNIIIPSGLVDLMATPARAKETTLRFARIVLKSFIEDDERRGRVVEPTVAETKRRMAICLRWFRILREEIGWSTPRVLDTLQAPLRAELDGMPWAPNEDSKVSTWAVPDSEKVMVATPEPLDGETRDG